MDQQTTQPTPDTGAPPDPDAAKYEALRQQLNIPRDDEPEPEVEAEPAPAEVEQQEPAEEPVDKRIARATEGIRNELSSERAARKASDDRLAQFMQIVREASNRPAEPVKDAPKTPTVEEDPIGFFKAEIAARDARIDALERGGRQSTQQLQEQVQLQAMREYVKEAETEIVKEHPDYWDACRHLEGLRIAQLDVFYPDDAPQAQAMARQGGFQSVPHMKAHMLDQDRQMVLAQSIQMGISPAQMYYNLAQRAGYVKAAPKAEPTKGQQQIAAAKRGRSASLSISGGDAGRKGEDDMSVTDLTAMFDEDPERATAIMRRMGERGMLG